MVTEFRKEGNWCTHEVVCLKCLHRYFAVALTSTPLKNYECPECGEIGYIILTGQPIEGAE